MRLTSLLLRQLSYDAGNVDVRDDEHGLLLDLSDGAQMYGHPEREKMRAEVRGHGRVVMKSIDSAAIADTY